MTAHRIWILPLFLLAILTLAAAASDDSDGYGIDLAAGGTGNDGSATVNLSDTRLSDISPPTWEVENP